MVALHALLALAQQKAAPLVPQKRDVAPGSARRHRSSTWLQRVRQGLQDDTGGCAASSTEAAAPIFMLVVRAMGSTDGWGCLTDGAALLCHDFVIVMR